MFVGTHQAGPPSMELRSLCCLSAWCKPQTGGPGPRGSGQHCGGLLSSLGCSRAGDPACARGLGDAAEAGGRQLLAQLWGGQRSRLWRGCLPGCFLWHSPLGRAQLLGTIPASRPGLAGGTRAHSQGREPCRRWRCWSRDGGSKADSKVSWGGPPAGPGGTPLSRRPGCSWGHWSEPGTDRLGRTLASFGRQHRQEPCGSAAKLHPSAAPRPPHGPVPTLHQHGLE